MDTLIDAIEHDLRLLLVEGMNPGARAFITGWLRSAYFEQPIARQRWRVIKGRLLIELRARAHVEKRTPREVLASETVAALYLAVGDIDWHAPDLFVRVRRAVQDTVCESLLGPGWRRSGSPKLYEHEDIEADPAVFDMTRAFGRLVQRDRAEAELLLNAASGASLSNTMRQRVSRARKKLRTACHKPPC